MVFAAALATIFMAAIEGTIVATAMPTIVGALGGIDLFSWIFGAYLLTQAILIPIYGRLSDLYGRKPVLLFGIGVFLVGSALCGLAWNMISLIAFRIVQGIGAGALIPVSQAVVADIYSGEARARMQGYISSTFGSAAIIGPMIGGLIATHVSWRAIFWINIPLGIIAASLLTVALKEDVKKRRHHIDYVGAVLMASATAIIMIALIHADTFSIAALAGAFGVSAMLIAALIFYESRTSEPMIPVRLYRDRLVAGGNWVGAANGAITMAVIGFLPVYMQGLMGSTHVDGRARAWSNVGLDAAWRLCRQPPRASHALSSFVHHWRRHSRDRKHVAHIASSRRRSVASDRRRRNHGFRHGHYQPYLRGRNPSQCRLGAARRGAVECVFLPHYRAVVRQRRIRRHTQCGTGKPKFGQRQRVRSPAPGRARSRSPMFGGLGRFSTRSPTRYTAFICSAA